MNLFKIGFLTVTLVDVVDLFIVSWIFYTVYQYFKGTRAGQMLVGLIILQMLLAIHVLKEFLAVQHQVVHVTAPVMWKIPAAYVVVPGRPMAMIVLVTVILL